MELCACAVAVEVVVADAVPVGCGGASTVVFPSLHPAAAAVGTRTARRRARPDLCMAQSLARTRAWRHKKALSFGRSVQEILDLATATGGSTAAVPRARVKA